MTTEEESEEFCATIQKHLVSSAEAYLHVPGRTVEEGEAILPRIPGIMDAVTSYGLLLREVGYTLPETLQLICEAIDHTGLDPSKFPRRRSVISDKLRQYISESSREHLQKDPLIKPKTLARIITKTADLAVKLLEESWGTLDDRLVQSPDRTAINVNMGRPAPTVSITLWHGNKKVGRTIRL
jgi:hypothetical protein